MRLRFCSPALWALVATLGLLVGAVSPVLASTLCAEPSCCRTVGDEKGSCCAPTSDCKCTVSSARHSHDSSPAAALPASISIELPLLPLARADFGWTSDRFCECQRERPRNHGPPGGFAFRSDAGRAPPLG